MAKFWSQVGQWTGRVHGSSDIAVDARRHEGMIELHLRTFDRVGKEVALRARLSTADGGMHEIGFVQRGPREYLGRLPDIPSGRYPLTVIRRDDTTSERTETVHIPAAETESQEEQPARQPNTALLTQLVDGTGGKMNPSVHDLLAGPAGSRRMAYPLDHLLLPLAMLLFLADVAVRRLRQT
jgi:hypothetical protein